MNGKETFQFTWGNYQTMGTVENNIETLTRENPWRKMSNVIEVSRANSIRMYHSKQDLELDNERGRMFLEEMPYLEFIQGMERAVASAWHTYREIRSVSVGTLTDERLYEIYEQLQKNWRGVIAYFYATQPEGVRALIEEMKKSLSPEELLLLLCPDKLDIVNQESIDWYELVQKAYSEELLYEHAYRYPWTVAAHFTYEDALETLNARRDYDWDHSKRPTIAEEKRMMHEKQQVILNEHPEVRDYARRAQRLALFRMEIKATYAGTDFYSIPVIYEMARRSGESPLDIHLYYFLKDGRDLIFDKRALSQSVKDARKCCFVGAAEDGRIVYKEGEEAESYARVRLGPLYEEERTFEGDMMTGVVAVKGRARGVVRVLHANDVPHARMLRQTFQKGEILVTEMTQPNILDIASRAGAIVTDEGGMLSHAAIISRELGIPCVVYTKIATKALQDGDRVEVDADKGIVRILERAK